MLPVINVTAAQVYTRIIPAPGGDCKLIDAASNAQAFPEYNLTVSGLAVSIACNLTANSNVPGSAINASNQANTPGAVSNPSISNNASTNAFGSPDNSTSTNSTVPGASPANAATNNQGAAYIAPPAASPFSVAFNSSNSVCLSSPNSNFCLPNGTYDQSFGIFGYSIEGVNAVTIPPGCSLTLQPHGASSKSSVSTFTTPQTPTDTAFATAITDLNKNQKSGRFSISSSASLHVPPAACFYTKPQFLGDVFCIGPGGANFSGSEVQVTQSVSVWGGATVWIYAVAYGDIGGQRLTASVPDLSTEPYGTNDNFLNKTLAAWIYGT